MTNQIESTYRTDVHMHQSLVVDHLPFVYATTTHGPRIPNFEPSCHLNREYCDLCHSTSNMAVTIMVVLCVVIVVESDNRQPNNDCRRPERRSSRPHRAEQTDDMCVTIL